MAPSDTFASPAFGSVLASFVIGITFGLIVALPAIRDDLAVVSVSDPGPVGSVVLVGVMSILVVTMGVFGLFRLFRLIG